MSIIATAANTLKFHQWPEGLIQHTYIPSQSENGPIQSLSWGRDGTWVVIAPSSGPPEVVSIRDTVKLVHTIDKICQPTCAVFQNNTKKNIAVGTLSGYVLLYDIKTREIRKRFPRASSPIFDLKCNSKDTHLVGASRNGEVLVYNNLTANLSSAHRVPESSTVSVVNFHRTKRNLLTAGSEEGMVAVWDFHTKAVLFKVLAHQAAVTNVNFSPIRSDLMVTSGLDRHFKFFDILANHELLEIKVDNSITTFDFSNCGTYLGFGSQNGTVLLYDTRSLKDPISSFVAHDSTIRHLMFQKTLLPAEQKNNSIYNIVAENVPKPQEVETQNNRRSVSFVYGNDSTLQVNPEKSTKHSVINETADSFLVAMGFHSSRTSIHSDVESKEDNNLGLGITKEVKKWMDTSKPSMVKKFLDSGNLTTTPVSRTSSRVTSSTPVDKTPKSMVEDLVVSPISDPSETKTIACHNCVSRDEIKGIIREVVKEGLDAHVEQMRVEFMNLSGHLRRHVLDLQMSIVKGFINIEDAVGKINTETTKEFICDQFLVNQNNKLMDELDVLKKRLGEKDSNFKF